eukprot:scaffold257027_cov35-Attheya_sp.AAC.1
MQHVLILSQQQARGTEDDESPLLLSKVPFARMLKSRDMENLKLELSHRGLSTEERWIACRSHLMHHEGDRDRASKYYQAPQSPGNY